MRTNFFFNDLPHKLEDAFEWMQSVRAYDPKIRKIRLRGPESVQIQTVDRCNATCIMCPYSAAGKSDRANVMDDDLYRHILEEIRRVGTATAVYVMLQNEPLLDRKLPDRVRIAKEILGHNFVIATVTNGAPLTLAMIEELDSSGIDKVSVSIDAFHENTFNKIRKGLNFQRVRENTIALIERLGPDRVGLPFLRQRDNEGEEDAFAQYWLQYGVPARFKEPTNRAGTLDSYMRVRKPRPALWKKLAYPILNRLVPACHLPFCGIPILWDGRVITCGEDWGPRDTIGDISKQPLEEIWNGEKMNYYRHLLWTQRGSESLVCAGCSLSENYWKI